MLLLLGHIQSLQSSSHQFVCLFKWNLIVVCVCIMKKNLLFFFFYLANKAWIQVNSYLPKASFTKQPQYPCCKDALPQAGQGFRPGNFSVTLVSNVVRRATMSGKALCHTPFIHFPPETCFSVLQNCFIFTQYQLSLTSSRYFCPCPHLPPSLQPCSLFLYLY